MGEGVCLLITLLNEREKYLVRCALKIYSKDAKALYFHSINCDINDHTRRFIHKMLPEHVRAIGPIVGVETIFEVAGTVHIIASHSGNEPIIAEEDAKLMTDKIKAELEK